MGRCLENKDWTLNLLTNTQQTTPTKYNPWKYHPRGERLLMTMTIFKRILFSSLIRDHCSSGRCMWWLHWLWRTLQVPPIPGTFIAGVIFPVYLCCWQDLLQPFLPSVPSQGSGILYQVAEGTAAFHSCLMERQGEKEVGSEKEQALSILANIYLQYNTAEPCLDSLVITFMLRPSHLATTRSAISGSS